MRTVFWIIVWVVALVLFPPAIFALVPFLILVYLESGYRRRRREDIAAGVKKALKDRERKR